MPYCCCGRRLNTLFGLQQHQRDKKHAFCQNCDLYFDSEDEFQEHRAGIHNHICWDCKSRFNTLEALRDHQRAKKHSYCTLCNKFLSRTVSLEDHLKSPPHVTQFSCCDCDRDFINEDALMQHLADKYHPEQAAKYAGFRCELCEKSFKTARSLEQHLESVKHKPLSDIKCIASKACKKYFSCPSAQLHHLESGACVSGVTKKKLDAMIMAQDTDEIITFSASQAETLGLEDAMVQLRIADSAQAMERELDSESDGGVVFTPTSSVFGESSDFFASSSGLLTPSSSLGLRTGLGTFGCPVCPRNAQRSFKTISALQDHIASPAHTKKMFHCPISLADTVRGADGDVVTMKQFSTLSGLAQHLESGACEGGKAMLNKAVDYIQEQMRTLGFAGIRLLR